MSFASLHNHTKYSLLDSTINPKTLFKQAKEFGYSAVAVTEHGNMFSYVECAKVAKEIGIKYIQGVEAYETTDINYKEKDADRYHIILLAQSEIGLKNLFKIVSKSYIDGFYGKPRVDLNLLKEHSEGVICLSACMAGRIARSIIKDEIDEAIKWIEKYKSVYQDNFYLEMQSHDVHEQEYINRKILELAKKTDTKYVITFDSHIIDGSELQQDIHRKFIQIGQDREVGEMYTGCWQTDINGIHEVMDKQIGKDAVQIGIDNTYEIAEKCNVEIELHRNLMPPAKIPEKFKDEKEYIKHLINEGWKKRNLDKLSKEEKIKYKERIQNEFEVLEYLDYLGYFLITSNIIDEFKNNKIPLGYSRGSAAGCLILYILGVTEIDSIQWDLDFARFANRGRKGHGADIDIDISRRRRQDAIEIASKIFGAKNMAQLATFNSLSPKVCIRDLGKVFDEEGIYNIPYAVRDKMAKIIPDDPSGESRIENALDSSAELREYEEKYPLLFEYTKYIQNLPKSVGCHASAIIVAPDDITNYAPLMLNKDGNTMLQLNMYHAMDDIGLMKLDFLGLKTLDIVDDTLKFAKLDWEDIDLKKINFEDENIYKEIYQKGNTLGVFQMESYVAQEMFKEMGADNIEDIFSVNAMNRPAILSMGMQNVYIKNKKERSTGESIHEDLIPIFEKTQNIMLFQEQSLKVFALAGFTEEEQDIARRSIGRKESDTMQSLSTKFKDGLRKKRWSESQIQEIWELIEKQSTYSFNRSHSVSYGILSYVTAWLKYYYPKEFMTALLISVEGDYQTTSKYISECKEMGINVFEPNINKSIETYKITENGILFGFMSVRNVGSTAVENILNERKNGKFNSLDDFLDRCKVDSSTVIALIKGGAFGKEKDELLIKYFHYNNKPLKFKPVISLPTKTILFKNNIIKDEDEFKDKETCLIKWNQHKEKIHIKNQNEKINKKLKEFQDKYMTLPEMYEFETLSIFLNENPFDRVVKYFKSFKEYKDKSKCVIIGTITSIKRKKQKNGKQYVYIEVLTPNEGMIEGVVFNSQLTKYREYIEKGNNVIILAEKNGGQFKADKFKSLEEWKKEKNIK